MNLKKYFLIIFIFFFYAAINYAEVKIPEEGPSFLYTKERFIEYEKNEMKMGGEGLYWSLNYNKYCNVKVTSSSSSKRTYIAKKAIDGKFNTAWVEGKNNNGQGEWIKIALRLKPKYYSNNLHVMRVGIFPGIGIEKYFKSNNRLKKIKCTIKTKNKTQKINFNFQDIFKMHIFVFEIPQDIVLNRKNPKAEFTFYIDETYEHSKWDDTCISELILNGTIDI